MEEIVDEVHCAACPTTHAFLQFKKPRDRNGFIRMAALGNALTALDVSICSPHAQEAGLDSTQTTVDCKLAHRGPHLKNLLAGKDVVGSQFRRSGFGNLACEASAFSVDLAPSSTRPNCVLTNRVFDPQDDRQHPPQSAVSLWETLDSKNQNPSVTPAMLSTCHVSGPTVR